MRILQLPNSSLVVTGSVDQKVKVWDTANNMWNLMLIYTGHTVWITAFAYINENTIASSSNDRTIQIWSFSTGATLKTINTIYEIWSLRLLGNGFHLAAGQAGNGYGFGYIQIYDINTGSLVTSLVGHSSSSYILDLVLLSNTNGNSDVLASSSGDWTVRIWNLTTLTCKFILNGHTDQVAGLKQISVTTLASSSYDNTIKLWDITSGQIVRTMSGHTSFVMWSIDILSDNLGDSLVSGSFDQNIKIWDLNTGQVLKTITSNLQIRSLATVIITTTTTTTAAITTTKGCLFIVKKKLYSKHQSMYLKKIRLQIKIFQVLDFLLKRL